MKTQTALKIAYRDLNHAIDLIRKAEKLMEDCNIGPGINDAGDLAEEMLGEIQIAIDEAKPVRCRISDNLYKLSHAHGPRGYGQWIFCPSAIIHQRDTDPNWMDDCVTATGEYATARSVARSVFQARGIDSAEVMP